MGAYEMNQNADNLIATKCRGVTRNFYRFVTWSRQYEKHFFWGERGGGGWQKPWEQCFELFRIQNGQNFPWRCPWIPLGRAYSTQPPSSPPDYLDAQQLSSLLCSSKNWHPQKDCWIQHWLNISSVEYSWELFTSNDKDCKICLKRGTDSCFINNYSHGNLR